MQNTGDHAWPSMRGWGRVGLAALCVCAVLSPAAFGQSAQFAPDSIFFNLVERPTRNTNVFGTQFDAGTGFVSDWGSNYLMYELKMSLPDQGYEFSNVYVQLVANRGNQNNDPANPLRFALFSQDPLLLNDSDALARGTINQAAVSPTFTPYLIGPAPGNVPVNIVDPEFYDNRYWLMLYAGGSGANRGYGVKVDSVLKDVEFYNNAGEPVQTQYRGGDPPTFQTAQAFVPLPEPSGFGVVIVAAFGMTTYRWGSRRLRRRKL